MKFMILIYGSPKAWDGLGEAEVAELADAHARVHRELTPTGELVAASELDLDSARVVRAQGGVATVTHDAFTEGREFISGYYIVECHDVDRATEIAGWFAETKFAPVEVRRLGSRSSWTDEPAS
ncbi:MAG: YciI family protein [Actinomycetes bacterium]